LFVKVNLCSAWQFANRARTEDVNAESRRDVSLRSTRSKEKIDELPCSDSKR
jgi:hypothetical protein